MVFMVGEGSTRVGMAVEPKLSRVLHDSIVRARGIRHLAIDCLSTAKSFHRIKRAHRVRHDHTLSYRHSLYQLGFLPFSERAYFLDPHMVRRGKSGSYAKVFEFSVKRVCRSGQPCAEPLLIFRIPKPPRSTKRIVAARNDAISTQLGDRQAPKRSARGDISSKICTIDLSV
jgi:hypothetical protein